MTNVGETICRLCLAKLDCDYEAIDEAKKKYLSSLLLELNLSISDNPVTCKKCARNLEHTFEFKATCLQTEEIIMAFAALSDRVTLDLKEIYLSENVNSGPQSDEDRVCRFCLTCVRKTSCLSLNLLKENMIVVRDMLPKCLPELDFSVTLQPFICTSCIKSMERYFTFSKICDEVEQKINKYNTELRVVGKIKLSDVVQFIAKDLMGNSGLNTHSHPVVKAEHDEGSVDVETESSEVFKMEQEVDIKDEVNIKNEHIKVDSVIQEKLPLPKGPMKSKSKRHVSKPKRKPKKRLKPKTSLNRCPLLKNAKHNHQDDYSKTSRIQEEYKCTLCPFKAKRKNHLAVHFLSHDPEKLYRCDLCAFETRRKNLLLSHTRVHREPKEELLKCVLCPFETKAKSSFRRHMNDHSKTGTKPNTVAQDLMIINEGGKLRLVRKGSEKK